MQNPFSIILLVGGLLFLGACQSSQPSLAIITGDGVRVRTSPRIQEHNDTGIRLHRNDTVEVLVNSPHSTSLMIEDEQVDAPWYRIQAEQGTGWVYGAYLRFLEDELPVLVSRERYIPPPPRLYRPRIYKRRGDGWIDRQQQNLGRWWKKNFGEQQQQELIKLIEACDFDNKIVRNKAVRVAGTQSGYFNLGQVCNLYDYANEQWGYVNDPPVREYVAKASETIENGTNGDCDDYSVLLTSLVVAIGGEARISYAANFNSAHAFAEVLIADTPELLASCKRYLSARYDTDFLPGFREDESGRYWMNLDWFSDFPGGTYYPYNYGTRFDILREQFEHL